MQASGLKYPSRVAALATGLLTFDFMKRPILILLLMLLLIAIGIAFYWHEDVRFWCDSQSTGLALFRGGYRSWSLNYSDGSMWKRGKLVAVTIDEKAGTIREGYHWPKYRHVDMGQLFYDRTIPKAE